MALKVTKKKGGAFVQRPLCEWLHCFDLAQSVKGQQEAEGVGGWEVGMRVRVRVRKGVGMEKWTHRQKETGEAVCLKNS